MEDHFKKLFNLQALDEHQIGCLEFLVNSPAYQDVVLPYLRAMRDSANQRLLDPSQERKAEYPDDFLRGNVVALDGLIRFFDRIVAETRFDRIAESQRTLTPAQQYTEGQAAGQHVPVLGANEPLEVEPDQYDPAEDY